jgi:NADPH:quinone reductase-like Zn-dependent oxidoreductase
MKAAVYRRFGAPEVVHLETVPKPVPRPGEVLIRVHASTVSAADYRARTRNVPRGLGVLVAASLGIFAPRKRVLGMDVAGTVESVGEGVTTYAAGDDVIAMLGGAFGGHAEYAVIRADGAIARKPMNLSHDEAVAIVFGGVTALAYLDRANITPGATVLVNGASGAVGSAAVQLAKQRGAHVTAVCSAGSAELVRKLGADEVIDYATTDFATTGRSYDVIVDCVGNAPFDRVAECITAGGALLLVVADLKSITSASRHSRTSGKTVTAAGVADTAEAIAPLVPLAEAGELRPVIDRRHDLADIVEAHRYVETGHKKGSVVLRVS